MIVTLTSYGIMVKQHAQTMPRRIRGHDHDHDQSESTRQMDMLSCCITASLSFCNVKVSSVRYTQLTTQAATPRNTWPCVSTWPSLTNHHTTPTARTDAAPPQCGGGRLASPHRASRASSFLPIPNQFPRVFSTSRLRCPRRRVKVQGASCWLYRRVSSGPRPYSAYQTKIHRPCAHHFHSTRWPDTHTGAPAPALAAFRVALQSPSQLSASFCILQRERERLQDLMAR